MKTTMKTNPIFFLSIIAVILSLATGCLNERPNQFEFDNDFQSSLDNTFVESEFSAMANQFDVEAQLSDDVKKTSSGYFCPCSVVEVEIVGNETFKMTIDFGTGCTCSDGRTRAGKLTGIFHGKWNQPGTYVEITPDNYQVTTLLGETYAFSFSKRLTYNGPAPDGSISFTVKVENASLTSSNGTISWESERTTSWVSGLGNLDPSDNVYLITGNASGTNANGLKFTAEIHDALQVEVGCGYITAGSFSITPEGKHARTLDYGEGTCDNKAQFSVGNFSTEITLR